MITHDLPRLAHLSRLGDVPAWLTLHRGLTRAGYAPSPVRCNPGRAPTAAPSIGALHAIAHGLYALITGRAYPPVWEATIATDPAWEGGPMVAWAVIVERDVFLPDSIYVWWDGAAVCWSFGLHTNACQGEETTIAEVCASAVNPPLNDWLALPEFGDILESWIIPPVDDSACALAPLPLLKWFDDLT